MKRKIGLEEHFAIEETIMDSHGFLAEKIWPELKSRLLDIQEKRVEFMDKFGVEMMILSLNAEQRRPVSSRAPSAASRAKDNPIIPGIFSVPERRSRSCPPP